MTRICQWIMRQREKTKRLDARGKKVPEYGLTPPGVTADWNRFAYRFFNDAQYFRGLKMAGRALANIEDPAAPDDSCDRTRTDRTHQPGSYAMQAKSPVVPLKMARGFNDPSLLEAATGNVVGFLARRGRKPQPMFIVSKPASIISWPTGCSIRAGKKTRIG